MSRTRLNDQSARAIRGPYRTFFDQTFMPNIRYEQMPRADERPRLCGPNGVAGGLSSAITLPMFALAWRSDELPKLDGFLRAIAVSVVSAPLALRRATADAVHSADTKTAYRGRVAWQPRPVRFGSTAKCAWAFCMELSLI